MATFPRTETAVVHLAGKVATGLAKHAEIFPSPPAPVAEMRAALRNYESARAAAIAADKAARDQYALKADALKHVTSLVKTNIRYAENTVRHNDEKLRLIGWGGPRPRTKLEPPGQVRKLVTGHQGEGEICLYWDKPEGGGKVAAYQLMSRRRGGPWQEAGMTLDTEVTLKDQERGVELEYRVIAVNKAGAGEPSNLVMAVL